MALTVTLTLTLTLMLTLFFAAQSEASHELMEATCALYGLIHARYVLTTAGLEAMYAKYTLQVRYLWICEFMVLCTRIDRLICEVTSVF